MIFRPPADGTQIDTYIDNLLAESSICYGGIAYHYVSDTYIALFSRPTSPNTCVATASPTRRSSAPAWAPVPRPAGSSTGSATG